MTTRVVFGVNGRGQRVEVTLKNVLFVPGLDGGLISVSQLAAKGFVAKFSASSCEIQNAKGESVVVGDKVSNLYRLRIHERSLKVSGASILGIIGLAIETLMCYGGSKRMTGKWFEFA